MTVIDRIAELSLLWKQAATVFPYFDVRPLDWDGIYKEYLGRVMEAEDERRYALVLAEFLNRLGDGHTDLNFSREILDQNGYLPFSLIYLEEGWHIEAIEDRGRELLLSRVESINGQPFGELLEKVFRYCYHVGDYAYPSRLSRLLPFFLKKEGNELGTSKGNYTFDLLASEPELIPFDPPVSRYSFHDISSGSTQMHLYEGGQLVITIENLLDSEAAKVIAEAGQRENISGIVLDMRKNIGGMTVYGANIARLFIPGEFGACSKRMRSIRGIHLSSGSQYAKMSQEAIARCVADGLCTMEEVQRSMDTVANRSYHEYTDSYGQPEDTALFDQPCVILTSRNSISAAEDVIAMFRTNRRATVMGTPTHGSTGTPLIVRLSCGSARICSIGYRLLDGTEFVGCGIQPDIHIETSAADMERQRDFLLDQALEYLAER